MPTRKAGRPYFRSCRRNLPRLISVGRLDFNTEGLLLLTNDGALARVLELPATGWLRRYRVRAHGAVTQAQLDPLRKGVTISGIHYGAIEAAIERVQGSNLWLTFAIREGKNREVRNVLGHLGLTVTRLIRVSFGPFQLGELDDGAVEEVPTRVLREQLGDKLAALSGADFSAPVTPPAPPRRQLRQARHAAEDATSKEPKSESRRRMPGARTRRIAATKKLHRKFHGARPRSQKGRERAGRTRCAPHVLTDRKGRPIAVERYGQPPVQEPREATTRRARTRQTRPSTIFARAEPPSFARSRRPARGRASRGAAIMRVVGGRLRGRPSPRRNRQAIRPTADRLRESLFNILVHAYGDPIGGARVLDLFAGTGALGIEAVSRGAAFVLFVDDGAEARALLRENVATLGPWRHHPHLPPRRHQARPGASDRAVLARLPRSALWPKSRRTGAGLGARRRLACRRTR